MIQDSGERREFKSGAVRDVQEGKGRCDLLPLDIVGGHIHNDVFYHIDNYVRCGDPEELHRALDEFIGESRANWCEAMLEVSKHYEDGCQKYGESQGVKISTVWHWASYHHGLRNKGNAKIAVKITDDEE